MWIFDILTTAYHWGVDVLLNFDQHISQWVDFAGPWIYVIVFLIIVCECGVLVTAFLPGDSLLFALGAVAAAPESPLYLGLLFPLLMTAGILGGILNYSLGRYFGPHIFQEDRSLWLNREHLLKTKAFYDRHGGKAVIFARFIPIFRTFVPFVAGIANMNYQRFTVFNVVGAIGWIASMTSAGYFFGNIPIVRDNFGAVIPLIIVISVTPIVLEFIRKKKRAKSKQAA